jgi:transposase
MNSVGIDLHRKRSHITVLRRARKAAAIAPDRQRRADARLAAAHRPGCPRRTSPRASCALRHRVALTRMRSALKNRGGAILAKHALARPNSDMFGPGGLRFLEALELGESPRHRLDSMPALIADCSREIDLTTREIDARAQEDPYVEVLCQIRGVGRYIAMLGDRRSRRPHLFPDSQAALLLAGLTPIVRSSDLCTRLGHISYQGSPALRLGAPRGRPARRARRRLAAPGVRADRQAPRPPGRQGRRRPQDPDALLLRLARRRDRLPCAGSVTAP